MRLTPFERRVVTACRAAATVCPGQLRLERHVLAALIEYATDVESLGGGAFGLRGAATGPCCLHLDADPSLLGYLVHRLSAADLGPEGRCTVVRGRPDRLELRPRDGHGRIVFHLDAAGVRALGEWERDLTLVYGGDRSARRTELPCPGAAQYGGGPAADVPASRELRRVVRGLPAVLHAHEASVSVRIETGSARDPRM
ncbi:hypothetical protein [Streptomyces sp. NRRL F-2580]|uniref:hypothetical protein n=1 Tax=Streptomyces sp. NRRL F-2580 TaxID=1463841 RepID=UPI00131C44DB|nr:hypothetical protein [Streptomyces sp. NRRL F-2580]